MDIGAAVIGVVVAVLGYLGKGLVDKLKERRSGQLSEMQIAWNQRDLAVKERNEANAQRDSEARGRRAWQEYGHGLRHWVHMTFNIAYRDMPETPICDRTND